MYFVVASSIGSSSRLLLRFDEILVEFDEHIKLTTKFFFAEEVVLRGCVIFFF